MYKIDNPHSLKSLAASLEMIDFQRDDFGQKLEEQFATFIAKCNDGMYTSEDEIAAAPEIRAVEELTFKRTGIKINIHRLYRTFVERVFGGITMKTASTIPLYVNVNHVYLDMHNSDMMRDVSIRDQSNFIKKLKDREGRIDEANARVGGFYSEHENDMFLDIPYLAKIGLNAGEVTAVYLHELGHIYTTMSHSARFDRTNQILANLSKELASKKKLEVKHVYREMELEAAGVSEKDYLDATKGAEMVPSALVFKALIMKVCSQTRDNTYNQTSSEQMADGFASRFGYGRQIVLGLDKLNKHGILSRVTNYGAAAWFVRNIIEILGVIAWFVNVGFIAGSIGQNAAMINAMDLWNRKGPGGHDAWYSFFPAVLIFLMNAFGSLTLLKVFVFLSVAAHIRGTGSDMRDWTYDDLYNRYKRIRNEAVASLKDLEIPPAESARIIADIKMIDDSMKSAWDNNKTLMTYLVNLVFPGANKASRDIDNQRLQEELAANDIFLKAAELRS